MTAQTQAVLAGVTLAGLVLYGFVTVGWRVLLQYRRTGDTGLRGRPHGAVGWLSGVVLLAGIVLGVLAPVAHLAGWTGPSEVSPVMWIPGGMAFVAGFALTVRAQLEMGDRWRIGVDPSEETSLVTHGLFRFVRNPIFSGMMLVFVGVALLVPGPLSWVGAALVVFGLQVHVRGVEEPYLARVHGARYAHYAAGTGRFIPGVGRRRRDERG